MKIYIADYGDTLRKIAAKYHLELSDFISVNPDITNPDINISGKAVNIPNIERTHHQIPPLCPTKPPTEFLDHWIPLTSLDKMEQTEYDVLIVGSGAGGAAALWRLCEQWEKTGKQIGMIDAGNLLLPTNVHNIGTLVESWERYFLNPKITRRIGTFLPEFSGANEVWALGGRTLFWWAVCPRMLFLEMKDWPIPFKEMERYYHIAEQVMNVSPAKTPLTEALLRRLWEGGFSNAGGTPYAVNDDLEKEYINPVRFFSSINFLSLGLLKQKFDLAVNARAVKILTENGKAVGVKVMTPEKKTYYLKAKNVVLSASTFETPRLLLHSGIQGRAIGHYLTNHSYITARAVMNTRDLPEDIESFNIIIPEAVNHPYEFTMHKQAKRSPEEIEIGFNGFGIVESRFENMVYLNPYKKDEYGVPEIQVNFSYSKKDQAIIAQMVDTLKKITSAMGATLLSVDNQPDVCLLAPGADNHEAVTCRMGKNPFTSVTNMYGQVHSVSGLYVADNSMLPSLGASNPTLTTVALAFRTADYIANAL